ncbi:hypothetical protein M885DRAFT_297254 [Pelagophyceae sp. CCMP2097]|nr:hypothetical protein M885DRAFT_297254 [Pelagophyceae sp. CCMP2097]
MDPSRSKKHKNVRGFGVIPGTTSKESSTLLRGAVALDAAVAHAHHALALERLARVDLTAAIGRGPCAAVDEHLAAVKCFAAALKGCAGLWEEARGSKDAHVSTLDDLETGEAKPSSRPPEGVKTVNAAMAARCAAMAQCCAIATAILTAKPPSLIARLCAAAAERLEFAHESTLKEIWHHARLRYGGELPAHAKLLHGIAALYSAFAARDTDKYGPQIGWLGAASKLVGAGTPLAAAIKTVLERAVHDNSTVYFAAVPKPEELDKLKPEALLLMKPEVPLPPYDGAVRFAKRQLTDEELARKLQAELNAS